MTWRASCPGCSPSCASHEHDPAVRKSDGGAEVVRVHHLDLMPDASVQIFRRLHRLETVGMPAEYGNLISKNNRMMTAAGR